MQKAAALAADTFGYVVELHQCFRNAQSLVVADHTHPEGSRSLCYHEGLIPSQEGAAPHAWLTLNGKIVDVTLQVDQNYEKLFKKIVYYQSKLVPPDVVKRYFDEARRTGKHGSVIGVVGIRM